MEALRTEATLEAYDGLELPLRNGRVVRCPTLTMAEAARYLRLLGKSKNVPEAHADFLVEFPERMNITGETLRDLGLIVTEPRDLPLDYPLDFGEMRYRDATNLASVLGTAAYHPDEYKRSRAQLIFLSRFPRKLQIDPDRLGPGDWFRLGHEFVERFYLLIYGMAQDFCYRQISGPTSLAPIPSRASSRADPS